MSMNVEGTIERKNMGPGTWALVTDGGQTYEIYQGAPAELLKPGQKVKVKGQIRDDVMTMAMIGPVLEVKSFEAIGSK
jgi:cytochrome c-type biogenesis protein CcmE